MTTEVIVRAIRSRDAGDPWDRAFAFYGIMKALGIFIETPDDEKLIEEIYQALFTTMLRSTRNLILVLDAGSPGYPGVPSWVPQWDALETKSWADAESIYHVRTSRSLSTGRSDEFLNGVVSGKLLKIGALFRRGEIAFCSERLRPITEIFTWSEDHLWNIRTLNDWIAGVRQDIRLLGNFSSLSECFYKVLHAGASGRDQTRTFNH
jgi:hypothetical protein